MFKTTSDTGFHMTFPNGWHVSVQWGRGNYASPNSAEVGYWHSDDTENMTVEGWQSPQAVAELLATVATLSPPTNQPKE